MHFEWNRLVTRTILAVALAVPCCTPALADEVSDSLADLSSSFNVSIGDEAVTVALGGEVEPLPSKPSEGEAASSSVTVVEVDAADEEADAGPSADATIESNGERPALDESLAPVSPSSKPVPIAGETPTLAPTEAAVEIAMADTAAEDSSEVADDSPPAIELNEPMDAEPEAASDITEVTPDEETADDADDVATESVTEPETKPTAEVSVGAELESPSTSSTDIGDTFIEHAKPEPALFHGIRPGESKQGELIESWGEPDSTAETDAGTLLSYEMSPFRIVDVLIENGIVTLVRVEFNHPEQLNDLRRKVHIDDLEAVELTDDASGNVLGYAVPERGMVLVIAGMEDVTPADSTRIGQMMLQPLDSQAFTLRAERRSIATVSDNIRDLKQAIALDESNAHAHWLLAGSHLLVGRAELAHTHAKQAVQLDAENADYRLRLAQTHIALAEYDQAVLITRDLLDDESVAQTIRAEAFFVMGELAGYGEVDIAEKAIGFYTTSIELADKLAASGDKLERRAAKRLLIQAHLAIGREVSRREFENKVESMSQWIGRASGVAEQAIEVGDMGLEARLMVASESLASLVNVKPVRDPSPLIKEAEETLRSIETEVTDPLWLEELEWRMGVAYLNAVRIEHHRRNTKTALTYANKALQLFAGGAEKRRDMPSTAQTVGRLYFHIGALHAVHRQDHAKAVEWYDRAEPLLRAERPMTTLYVPRRDGEALVSMAVSYWDQDDYQHAIELTEAGAKQIEQAVAGGVVDKPTLAVPYGNLSLMHKQLGNPTTSLKYAKMAEASKRAVSGEQATRALPKQPFATGNSSRPQGNSNPQRTSRPATTNQRQASDRPSSNQARVATQPQPQQQRGASGSSRRRGGRSFQR